MFWLNSQAYSFRHPEDWTRYLLLQPFKSGFLLTVEMTWVEGVITGKGNTLNYLRALLPGKRSARNRGLRSFLFQVYVCCFFDELILIYSFYAVMFSECGLNALQISVLLTTWSTVAFLLEVPSGALADKYSRKYILLLAQVFKACCFACWMLFPSFPGFLMGFVCWGIKGALASGTFEALVFDELKHYGVEDNYARVIGRTRSIETVGVLIASLLAAAMVRLGYKPMLIASVVSLIISCIAVMLMRPAEKVESTGETCYFTLLKDGVGEAVKNRVILRLILFLSFALCFFGTLEEYWTLFYAEAGISKMGIAILCAAETAVRAISGITAHRFKHLSERAFYIIYLASSSSILIAAYLVRPISAVFLILPYVPAVMIDIVLEARLQDSIRGEARATVMSVRGFLGETGSICIFMGFGALAAKSGYSGGFMGCAVVMMVIGVLYVIFGGNRCRVSGDGDVA